MYEELLLQAGFAGVVIVAWFFFNNSNMKAFNDIMKDQARREELNSTLVSQLIKSQADRSQELHESLAEMIAVNRALIEQFNELKYLVMNHSQCPFNRKKQQENEL